MDLEWVTEEELFGLANEAPPPDPSLILTNFDFAYVSSYKYFKKIPTQRRNT